jgi:hypothetical protein
LYAKLKDMRKIYTLVLLLAAGIAQAQDRKPDGGGSYVPEATECVTPELRAQTEKMLQSNIKMLREKGIIKGQANGKTTATMFDWPLKQVGTSYFCYYGISNFVDHDTTYPSHLKDWNCGARTYDLASGYNHAGTDIFLWPFYWNTMDAMKVEIIAAAPGTIVGKYDGNYDRNCAMGSSNWNAVYVMHADGTVAWYGHMKSGSPTTKNVGDAVIAGEHLGFVGSSGSSTGPHLHFEVHDAAGNVRDPFSGSCNTLSSLWNTQKPYTDPTVNALFTHFAPPGIAPCPNDDTLNSRDTFLPGSTIYFATYYHDQQASLVATYTISKPDGSLFQTWTSSAGTYSASYWYWSFTLATTQPTGAWDFNVSYNGTVSHHKFYVGHFANEVVDLNKGGAVTVYPNPASGAITVEGEGITRLELRNAVGQTVYTASDCPATFKIDVANFPKGMYFVSTTCNGVASVQKVMLQ